MKTPSGSPGAVAALLATRHFIFADLFKLTTALGDVFRYTSAQVPVTVTPLGEGSPATYSATSVKFEGLKVAAVVGLQVQEQTVTVSAKPTDLLYGIPFLTALRLGLLDGARITRDRWFAPSWAAPNTAQTWTGGVHMFAGRVSSIESAGRVQGSIKVKSDLVLLDQQYPRETYQPSCLNTLYDAPCTLVKESFGTNGAVGASPTASLIPWAGALATFTQGVIRMTSGANNGQSRTVKLATGAALVVAYPWFVVPSPGDTFRAYRGCNKKYTDAGGCSGFSNQVNFRGYPATPSPETAV